MRQLINIVIICICLFIMDKQAAIYGNGVIHLYKNLNYHISFTKINHHYFLYGDLGYIIPQEYYDQLYIENIIGYLDNREELKIYISTNKNIKSLSFHNEMMVIEKKPIIKEEKNLPNNIINLKSIPFIYYYWKIFFMIGVLINIILFLNFIIHTHHKIFK